MLTIDENVEVFRIEFVDGDGATMTVASGKTVISEVIEGVGHILNNGVLVKTGAGMLELPFDRDSAGETVVSNGTVKVASVTGTGTSHQVRVASGATFDVNAIQNIHVVLRLEAGATYTNGKQYSGNLYNVYLPVRIILDDDATATATYSFGIDGPNHGTTQIDLGTNTLTLNGTSNCEFMFYNTTVNGTGKIVVDGVRLRTYANNPGDDWTLEVEEDGEVSINGTGLTVGNFINGGAVSGAAKLTVKGTLTPGSSAISSLALADGATVKLTGTDNAQTVSTTFAASGTVTIDASAIPSAYWHAAKPNPIPVLTLPSKPEGVAWAVAGAERPDIGVRWNAASSTLHLYKSTGMVVIFR